MTAQAKPAAKLEMMDYVAAVDNPNLLGRFQHFGRAGWAIVKWQYPSGRYAPATPVPVDRLRRVTNKELPKLKRRLAEKQS